MRVVLRRMDSLAGMSVSTDEVLDVDRVTLGRGTDQDVQLPDVRVTLAHAEIRLQPGGGYRIECQGDNPVWVNGSPAQGAALGAGDTIDLGRFRITIGRPEPDVDLLLEIEEHVSAREDKGRRRGEYRMTLGEAGLGKRRVAWGLAALVLLATLAVPAVLRYASDGNAGRSLDAIWQAGPSSAAHSPFVQDCDVCHERPFASVRNEACMACHKTQAHHSDRPEVLALDDMDDARCGTCHLEHTGREALIARETELCTDCHADPDERYAVAALPPVSRFDGDHPAFTLSLPVRRDGALARLEVEQREGATLREESGLRFPHDVHVAADGLASPDGHRVLACADCHRPAGTSFVAIRMEDHCAACHRLDFDPDQPARRLPHGEPDEVAAIVRDHFARTALAGEVRDPAAPEVVRMVRRPGAVLAPEQSKAAMAWADQRAQQVLADVFERRVCAECHDVTRPDPAQMHWRIAEVSLTETYLRGARFDHTAHSEEACERCHTPQTSGASTDVMVPPLATCRECHGDPGVSGRMGSACVDCHGFHIAEKKRFTLMEAPQ